jgi:tripartite ATP-independent transporter DctM subunit
VYTLVVGFVFYGGVDRETLIETTYEGMVITAAITFIVAVAALYALLIRRVQVHLLIGDVLTAMTGSTVVLLLAIVIAMLLVGTFLETIAAITIFVPILHPIIVQMGIDPIHFGIVLTIALMIGLLTPPLGLVLFILERITDVTLEQIFRSILPFYVPLVLVLLLVVIFPEISLWLPRTAGLL